MNSSADYDLVPLPRRLGGYCLRPRYLTLDELPTRLRRLVRRSRDALDPIPKGKLLIGGTLWTGDLQPRLDGSLDVLERSIDDLMRRMDETDFSLNHTANAESAPAQVDLLGRAFLGNMSTVLRSRAHDGSAAKPGDVDVTELVAKIDETTATRGPLTFVTLGDVLRDIRRVKDALTAGRRTGDAGARPMIGRSRTVGNFGERTSPGAINDRNSDYWTRRLIGDNAAAQVGKMRDALAEADRARKAGDARGMVESINAANRALWASRTAAR